MAAGQGEPEGIAFPIAGIDDGVVRLRLPSDADVAAIVVATRDPEIARWTLIPLDNSAGVVEAWIGSGERGRAAGLGLHLLVVDAETDALLGAVGIEPVELGKGRCSLGYWLAAEARGRGAMTRAVRLLCAWVLEHLSIERISIEVAVGNGASRAVAERAGFTYEGVLRSHYGREGRRFDAASYSLLRGEL